jgi:hypothetical protein
MRREDPDALVSLTTAFNYFEAETIAAALRAEDIPVYVESIVGTTLGYAAPALGDAIHVRVRHRDVELARRLLDRNRSDSVDLDWSEVDVGEPEDPLVHARPRLRASKWAKPALLWLVVVPGLSIFVLYQLGGLLRAPSAMILIAIVIGLLFMFTLALGRLLPRR